MKKSIIYLINLPLYYLSLIIPKNKNIWIFGAWFGMQYSDNSKALYEYVKKHDKSIKLIWLTTDKKIFKDLKNSNDNVYYTYSIQGYYYSALAKFIFVSTGMTDVNRYVSSTKFKVQLWHGTPLKKIHDDINKHKSKKLKVLKGYVFPFNVSNYEFMTIASEYSKLNYQTAFNNVKHFNVTGYPRNDVLKSFFDMKTIIYLPTHRGEGNGNIEHIFNTFDIDVINQKLKKISYKLIVKLHYYDLSRINYPDKSNIVFLSEGLDVYQLLQQASMLITDYSSIYFDFLLTQRPIIFTPFDIEEYQKNDREFYYNYDQVSPGPKCKNWLEAIEWIERFDKNKTLYSKERYKVNKLFNDYNDFDSCERVYKIIKKNSNA